LVSPRRTLGVPPRAAPMEAPCLACWLLGAFVELEGAHLPILWEVAIKTRLLAAAASMPVLPLPRPDCQPEAGGGAERWGGVLEENRTGTTCIQHYYYLHSLCYCCTGGPASSVVEHGGSVGSEGIVGVFSVSSWPVAGLGPRWAWTSRGAWSSRPLIVVALVRPECGVRCGVCPRAGRGARRASGTRAQGTAGVTGS
jgi:hypothetical protein